MQAISRIVDSFKDSPILTLKACFLARQEQLFNGRDKCCIHLHLKMCFYFHLRLLFFRRPKNDELMYLGMANSFMMKYWDWRVVVIAVESHLL